MRISLIPTALATCLAATACIPELLVPVDTQDPQMQPPPTNPPKNPTAPVTGFSIEPTSLELEVDGAEALMAKASYDDGSEIIVSEGVTWASADDSIVIVDAVGWVTAVSEGTSAITATYEGLTAQSTMVVTAPGVQLESIELSQTSLDLSEGASRTLILTATFTDQTSQDVTATAVWTSSNPSVATVLSGVVTVASVGQATIRAEYLGQAAEAAVTVQACTYPGSMSSPIQVGSTMPPLSWGDAYAADGSQFNLDLEQVHCGDALGSPSVLLFVVGAGWCTACPQYFRTVAGQLDAFEAAGGQVVFMEVQDRSYNPGTSDFATGHVDSMIGANGGGIRVGDTASRDIYNAPLVRAFPSAFVVRVRDMKILIDQASSNSVLPFVRIAQNPDADWSNPNAPPFSNNCGAGDEEASEPNDAPTQAASLTQGTASGGICAAGADFYRVDMAGNWRLDVQFSHSVGDIDLLVWDETTNQAVRQNGQNVGATSGTDNEQLDWQGPALIRIFGFENASAPYTLSLSPR